MRYLITLIALMALPKIYAQQPSHSHSAKSAFDFPDIPGYKTLKTDFHQHTVFSDGKVWPSIRVMEALRDNLDVISLTEHIEYQPHADDIPHPDRNRAYEIALSEAKNHDLLIANGSEITRDKPVGHNNAIFVTDANKLVADDPKVPFAEAKKQGAFVFWNHPAWFPQSPTGNPIFSDFQAERVKNGELHGIEVINEYDYAEESLALALEHNLTIMGTSDIHGLIDWHYTEKGHERPITLVFAKERHLEGVKEALIAGRTVATFNNLFVGRNEYLKPLLEACISVVSAKYRKNTSILELSLKNNSSSDLWLENDMDYTFYNHGPVFEIPAHGEITLKVKTLQHLSNLELKLKALKAYIAPKQNPILQWSISIE